MMEAMMSGKEKRPGRYKDLPKLYPSENKTAKG
jgi:hypothetical protein